MLRLMCFGIAACVACGPTELAPEPEPQVGVLRQEGREGQGREGQGREGQGREGQGGTVLGSGRVYAFNRGSWQMRTGVGKGGAGIYTTGYADLAVVIAGRKGTEVTVGGTRISSTTTTLDQTGGYLVRGGEIVQLLPPMATMLLQELDSNMNPVAGSNREARIVNTWVDDNSKNLMAADPRSQVTSTWPLLGNVIRYYKVQVRSTTNPAVWENFCKGDGDSGRLVFFPGIFTSSGAFIAGTQQYMSYACIDGTAAKCVRWGYRPWMSVTQQNRFGGTWSVALEPLWRACYRAASADYCNNGLGYTEDGRRVDIWDRYGLIPKYAETNGWVDANGIPEAYSDESAFDEQGAVCLVRERLFALNFTSASCPMQATFIGGNELCTSGQLSSGTWSSCGPKGTVWAPTNVFDRKGGLTCDQVASRPPLVYVSSYDTCFSYPMDESHTPFTTGGALGYDCNNVTRSVCLSRPSCCAENENGYLLNTRADGSYAWDSTCVSIAHSVVNGTWTPPFVQ